MKEKISNVLSMTVGSVLMALGVYFFKIPNGFATGGVSGIATIFGYILPLTPATLIIIINVSLLVIGTLVLGRNAIVRTVYCSLLFSGLTWLFEVVYPLTLPLTDIPFLELVYAVLLTGLGSAIIFRSGGSSGGTDIVALILKKYSTLDVGKALLVTDAAVAFSSFFVFGLESGLFSLLGLFAKAFLIDGVIENLNLCKSFMIITSNPEPIVDYVINDMKHSATTVSGTGEYSGQPKTVIYVLCKRIEAVRFKAKIKEIDKDAFVIVQSTSEMIGRGFRSV